MEESSTSVALEKGISVTQTQKAVSFAVKSKTCRVVPVRAAGGGEKPLLESESYAGRDIPLMHAMCANAFYRYRGVWAPKLLSTASCIYSAVKGRLILD